MKNILNINHVGVHLMVRTVNYMLINGGIKMLKKLLLFKIEREHLVIKDVRTEEILFVCSQEFTETIFDTVKTEKGLLFKFDPEKKDLTLVNDV